MYVCVYIFTCIVCMGVYARLRPANSWSCAICIQSKALRSLSQIVLNQRLLLRFSRSVNLRLRPVAFISLCERPLIRVNIYFLLFLYIVYVTCICISIDFFFFYVFFSYFISFFLFISSKHKRNRIVKRVLNTNSNPLSFAKY